MRELAKSQRVIALVGKGSFKMMTMREKRQGEKKTSASVTMASNHKAYSSFWCLLKCQYDPLIPETVKNNVIHTQA